MRKCKIDDYARNGVRVSQYSKFILLGALAFLCLAIVSLCVFSNLNALATDNIAFADDEKLPVPIRVEDCTNEQGLRVITSNGYYEDNIIPNSWTGFWDYNLTLSSQTVFYDDGNWRFRFTGSGTINGGTITTTSASSILIWLYNDSSLNLPSGNYVFAIGYSFPVTCTLNATMFGIQYNFNLNSSLSYYATPYHNGSFNNNNYFFINLPSGYTFNIYWFGMYNSSQFNGYVSPDYKYYGYNQGYADGSNAGGGSSDPEFPIDTGFVGTNLMPNSYCLGYTYDSHINTTSDRYYSDSDWVYTYGYGTGQYSLVNNVLTNVSANYVALKYEGSLPSGDYTFTLGFTSSYTYDVEVDVYNSSTFDTYGEHVEKFENEAPYWISSSFTIPNSNMRSSGTPVTIIVTCFLDNNTSINLNYIKLETGSVFTGYAIDDNGNYQDGYDDGLTEGYTTGYDDGVTQATIDFDYIVWSSTVNTSSGLVANIDQLEFNPNTYDNSSVFIRVYSVDNQAHTYVDPVTCSFYITFDNTLSTGFVIYIDFNFNVDFTGSQKIGYTFAPLDTGYNSDEAWGFRDGVFDNNTSGIMLIVPRTSNRLYFSFGVTETKGVSGAGGLPLYYLYSFSVSGDNKVLANSVGANSDIVEDAYNRGKQDGFLLGQIDGEQRNPYSFKSLFSSIYDVPVGAFNNMFNFDVFGVNFRTFLLAMISLALGLFIWKVIVRGG